jgi:hypothetical protein
MILASEIVRELPVPAIAFGGITFGILVFLLYLTLRLDK